MRTDRFYPKIILIAPWNKTRYNTFEKHQLLLYKLGKEKRPPTKSVLFTDYNYAAVGILFFGNHRR